MRLRARSIIVVLLAALGAAGCQSEGARTTRERPAEPGLAEAAPPKQPASPLPQASSTTSETPDRFQGYVPVKRPPQEITLVSHPTAVAPVIDGRAEEPVWKSVPGITTLDYSSQRAITLKSVFTREEVFFLVTFPKDVPSVTHKTWTWDPKEQVYREGPDREDVFLFKWSMSGNDVRLELRDPEPHRGDIWFWKARRTNPSGYADDKWQSVTTTPGRDAVKIQTSRNGALYLRRVADAGTAAWEEKFFFRYQGDKVEKYVPQQPQGSRADVRAKGTWANGQWTIEFARKLRTGHDDDVAFAPGGVYLFGVACYAIAYDTPHPEWSQAMYRTGDVFDRLLLSIPRSAGR